MKKLLLVFFSICLHVVSSAQFIHKIKADSVLITNDSCSAELNLENTTKNIKGFLYNTGNGRTIFKRGMTKLNDSIYIFGADTLRLLNALTNLGFSGINLYNSNGSITGNREITLNGNSLKIAGSSIQTNWFSNGRFWLGSGTPTDAGYTLDINGTARVLGQLTYKGDLVPNQTTNMYCLGLLQTASFGVLRAYTNNGGTALQQFEFGYNLTSLNNSVGLTNTTHNNFTLRLYGTQSATGPGGGTYSDFKIAPTYNFSGNSNSGTVYGISYEPTVTNLTNVTLIAFRNTVGNVFLNTVSGRTSIGGTTDFTSAKLSVNSTTEGFLPPRLTKNQRQSVSTPAIGLVLYQTDSTENMYINKSTGWKRVLTDDDVPSIISGSFTLDFSSTSAGTASDLTVTVTGAQEGDVVSIGIPNGVAISNTCFTAWVSAADTVTIRFNNYSSSNADPSSGLFKVKIMK